MQARRIDRPAPTLALALLLGVVLAAVIGRVDATTGRAGPPPGNSAWVYDALYPDGHRHGSLPAGFADALNRYNAGTPAAHAITRVFTYAGSLEMYCGDGDRRCQPQDLKLVLGTDGRRSVAAYAAQLRAVDGRQPNVVAVIDGSIRAHYPGSLHGFDRLDPDLAQAFADQVARSICAIPQVAGVQFDLEPFNVRNKNGQYYFYERIAEDFAGDSGPGHQDAFNCVDAAHPRGRYFSVFGAAHDLDPDRAAGRHLQRLLTAHHNGFFIVTLYDLSDQPAGHRNSLAEYARKAQRQAQRAARGALELGIPFQFAVPASASTHAYARCDGPGCHHHGTPHQYSDPEPQLGYLRAAMEAIKASGARNSPLYLGTAVWAWSHAITHAGMRFSPSIPTAAELEYLRDHL